MFLHKIDSFLVKISHRTQKNLQIIKCLNMFANFSTVKLNSECFGMKWIIGQTFRCVQKYRERHHLKPSTCRREHMKKKSSCTFPSSFSTSPPFLLHWGEAKRGEDFNYHCFWMCVKCIFIYWRWLYQHIFCIEAQAQKHKLNGKISYLTINLSNVLSILEISTLQIWNGNEKWPSFLHS